MMVVLRTDLSSMTRRYPLNSFSVSRLMGGRESAPDASMLLAARWLALDLPGLGSPLLSALVLGPRPSADAFNVACFARG